ncbi:hypothetical protein M405DRAFT_934148 [Rhizopogon salebrosus TDB-379]|nr:hypothetical protein M405DRAFT_934148 [Rhizopogon salebrosus TDB-379]
MPQISSDSNPVLKKVKKKDCNVDPHKEYLAAARCIARCVDMFCNIDKTIDIGMLLKQHKLADASEDKDNVIRSCQSCTSQKARDRYQQNFKRLFELAPGLKHLIGSSDCKKTAELDKIIGKMESAISRTRSDDSTHLKTHIGHYVAPNPAEAAVSPPIHDGSGRRTHMGINHPVLPRFLCPIGEIARFDEDSKTQEGKIRMTADACPAFLWKGDPPGANYDPDDMMFGFLEGYTLERVGIVITPLFMLLTVFSGNAAHFHRPANRLWWAIAWNPTLQCRVAPYDYRPHSLWLCTGPVRNKLEKSLDRGDSKLLVPPPAQTTVCPSSSIREHSPPSSRTPPPSSSPVPPRPTPRPVPRPAQENSHRPPRTPPPTLPTRNIPPPHLASPPAQATSKAEDQASNSELASSEEEEEPQPKLKRRAPAKRIGKSKAVEIQSDDEPEPPTRPKHKASAPAKKAHHHEAEEINNTVVSGTSRLYFFPLHHFQDFLRRRTHQRSL